MELNINEETVYLEGRTFVGLKGNTLCVYESCWYYNICVSFTRDTTISPVYGTTLIPQVSKELEPVLLWRTNCD